LLSDLDITTQSYMIFFCDSQAACHIALNPVFHEGTKYIEVDCYFIREKIQSTKIETPFIRSEDQLTNIFKKGLEPTPSNINTSKLKLIDTYNPT
jgi:hypothetical protein